MFTNSGVFERQAICSAIDMKRLLNTSRHDRVALGAHREGPLERDNAGENQVALRREFGLPAGLDDGRAVCSRTMAGP